MPNTDLSRPNEEQLDVLRRASSASITSILRRLGVESCWMPLYPLVPGSKLVGPALTIRTVPGREDLEHLSHTPGTSFPRHPEDAIDAVQPGDVVVQDGGRSTRGAIFGDLLTLRLQVRGAGGLVTDMPVRDADRLAEQPVPIFCAGASSPGSFVFNIEWNVPIGCAGVLVFPGDVLVGDGDGVVVIPQALVGAVVGEILEFEDREDYIRFMLCQGHRLGGLYPPDEEMEALFQKWRNQTGKNAANGSQT